MLKWVFGGETAVWRWHVVRVLRWPIAGKSCVVCMGFWEWPLAEGCRCLILALEALEHYHADSEARLGRYQGSVLTMSSQVSGLLLGESQGACLNLHKWVPEGIVWLTGSNLRENDLLLELLYHVMVLLVFLRFNLMLAYFSMFLSCMKLAPHQSSFYRTILFFCSAHFAANWDYTLLVVPHAKDH